MGTKIFMGYLYDNALKAQLFHSLSWKNSCDLKDSKLCLVTHQKNQYYGLFLSDIIEWATIEEKEAFIREIMLSYSPELNFTKLTLYLFPQIFVY